MIETKKEMQVGIQKGHLTYQKIKSLLDLWFRIFSSRWKAFPLDFFSQATDSTYSLDEASNSWKCSSSLAPKENLMCKSVPILVIF
jgi:hypothetical protein